LISLLAAELALSAWGPLAGIHSSSATFKMAFEIWVMCPLPLIVTNALFMKLQPMIAAAHSFGWLVKLSAAALAVVLISK
jgi:hypothetical protein